MSVIDSPAENPCGRGRDFNLIGMIHKKKNSLMAVRTAQSNLQYDKQLTC